MNKLRWPLWPFWVSFPSTASVITDVVLILPSVTAASCVLLHLESIPCLYSTKNDHINSIVHPALTACPTYAGWVSGLRPAFLHRRCSLVSRHVTHGVEDNGHGGASEERQAHCRGWKAHMVAKRDIHSLFLAIIKIEYLLNEGHLTSCACRRHGCVCHRR